MKRLATLLCIFSFALIQAQEASFKNFYDNNKDASEFSLNISASMANSFLSKEDTNELSSFLKKSDNYKVLLFNNRNRNIEKRFQKFARKQHLKTLVRIKDNGDKIEVFFVEKQDYVREIIIKIGSNKDELVLLGLKTKITKDELSSLMASAKNSIASN